MHKPRIRPSHSVDSILPNQQNKKSTRVLARRESHNPESKTEAIAVCLPADTVQPQQHHYQRVSRKLSIHYQTVDKWKEKYECCSTDKKVVRKFGKLFQQGPKLHISTPKRRSVVELPKLAPESFQSPHKYNIADRSRSIKNSQTVASDYLNNVIPVHSLQVLHQQTTQPTEFPNSLFPEMLVARKKLSETIMLKRRDFNKIEETLLPPKQIKRRSDLKINKSIKRPYFDQLLDQMAEESPSGWNNHEEDRHDQANNPTSWPEDGN